MESASGSCADSSMDPSVAACLARSAWFSQTFRIRVRLPLHFAPRGVVLAARGPHLTVLPDDVMQPIYTQIRSKLAFVLQVRLAPDMVTDF